MKQKPREIFSGARMLRTTLMAAVLATSAGAYLWPATATAQTVTASLSGTVKDATGAVIPGAKVVLRNEQSGETHTLRSNGQGFFTFAGVAAANYTVVVTAQGFQQFTEKGLHLDPGDSRSLGSVVLPTGPATSTVTVTAESNVPLDTGERSDLITADEIKHLSVEGRDVTELLKTLPGFAIANQGVTNTTYDPSQVNVNGALGNYAANGNPVGGIDLKLDGADITDPGNYGAAIQNVNYDQVSEVKVDVSNFGAELANGPVVINVLTRAGGSQFHGELYTYARIPQLDSMDALSKATGEPKAPDREIYPGAEIGGPILIPGTKFNRNKTLTFFVGAEDYAQRNIYAYGNAAAALVHALVPTAAMRGGDFSQTALESYLGPNLYSQGSYSQLATVPTFAINDPPASATVTTGSIVNGQIPSADKDKGFAYIWNTMPLPNMVPTLANPYNWQSQDLINNDMWQVTSRVDLTIGQKNHLFGRYTVERGGQGYPSAIYYNPGELNTPGGGLSKVNSESAAANLTTAFNSTMTNQLFGGLGYLDQAYVSANPTVLANYPYEGAYKNGRHPLPMLGNYDDASGLPRMLTPDYTLGPIFAHKFIPDGGDTLSKVWGTHSASFGVYVVRVTNNQRVPNDDTNGSLSQYYSGGAGTQFTNVNGAMETLSGNWAANNYEGMIPTYSQQNFEPQTNLYFWDTDFFANDQWRIKPHFTINYGLRVQHIGEWKDAYGQGLAVFEPALIASGASNSPYPGFLWHGIDSSIPVSGVNAKPAFLDPRVGFAWDIHGNGSTVLRGGWGEYRSHDSWNDVSNDVNVTQNIQSVTYGPATLAALQGIATTKPLTNTTSYPAGVNVAAPGSYGAPGTMYAMNPHDNEEPLTDTYSLTLNQQMPWRMNLLVGYVGDNSRFLLNDGSNQTVALDNVNAMPIGTLYKPNPYTGQILLPVGSNVNSSAGFSTVVSDASAAQQNEYRPLNTALVQYGAIDVPTHNLFANYNGLQLGLVRQTGRVMFNVNYTFSHALGIIGALDTGEPANPFNLWDNYGPENYDRRHIFNASYTFEGGNPVHNRFLGGFVNGWEMSGITNYQSGVNIATSTTSPGFALSGNIGCSTVGCSTASGAPANPAYIAIENTVYLGTPDVSLQPTLVCDPKGGLGKHQYINGNCFGTPNLLQNGVYRLPDFRGPGFFETDLFVQKTFGLPHSESLQFRFSAFNFINHALSTFTGDFTNQYEANLTNTAGTNFNQGSGANATALGFGQAPYETGRRVSEMMLKYNF